MRTAEELSTASLNLKQNVMVEYNQEMADFIIDRLCEGELLTDICKADGTPNPKHVRLWTLDNPEFSKQFEQARLMQADVLFEEAVTIGRTTVTAAVDRLRVDTLLKAAAVLQPKKYGDKKEVKDTVNVNIHSSLDLNNGKVIQSGPYIIEAEKVVSKEVN
jgi:hypothetical protein